MFSSVVDPQLTPPDVIGEPNVKPRFQVVGPEGHNVAMPFIPKKPSLPVKKLGDVFWTEDVEILWRDRRWMQFFPKEQDTYEEKLNSVMRAFLYISFVLALLYFDITYVWVALLGVILTVFLYSQEDKKSGKEQFITGESSPAPFKPLKDTPVQYVQPSEDNPMMNVQLTDYRENPNREAISKVAEADDPEMKKAIDDAFYSRMFRDVSDVYSTVASERNFYTMPVTTIPNDQKAFAEFCYGTPPTCKEGNGFQCMVNTDREDYLRSGSRPVQL